MFRAFFILFLQLNYSCPLVANDFIIEKYLNESSKICVQFALQQTLLWLCSTGNYSTPSDQLH